MNKIVLALVTLLLVLTGCSVGGAPSDGDTAYHGPLDAQGYDEGGEFATPVVIDGFTATHRYPDGIEVTPKITTGEVTSALREYEGRYAAEEDLPEVGEGWVNVLISVKNGTDTPFDAKDLYKTFTYGAQNAEPEFGSDIQYLNKNTAFNTYILPGKSREGGETYLIPKKEWGEATLEVERPGFAPVIYTGAL